MLSFNYEKSVPVGRDSKNIFVFGNETYKKINLEQFSRFYKMALQSTNERLNSLHESSLGKVLQHSEKGVAIVSACRGEYDENTNKERTKWLENDLRALGFGYIKLIGGYVETDIETGEKRDVVEASFMIPYDSRITPENWRKKLLTLCKNYDQESILIKMPNEDDINYIRKDGSIDTKVGKFSMKKKYLVQYFSMLLKGSHRNRKWAFKTIEKSTDHGIEDIDKQTEVETEWIGVRTPANSTDARRMDKYRMIRL